MSFLAFSTPREVLEKAEQALIPLLREPTPTTVFDFFAAAHHIFDYAEKRSVVPRLALDSLRQTRDMRACADLANKSKHARLDRNRADPAAAAFHGTLNGAPLNAMPLNGGDQFMVWTQDGNFEVRELAKRVLTSWDLLLKQHGV